ncbi:MAG: helix-turn-helix domain-containing protein, partial [Rhodococcus sp. (in: high G+C Gram-positive bacteria)]
VLTSARCRELTDDAGRGAVAVITARCVAFAADVLDSGRQPSADALAGLRGDAAEWARVGVPLGPVQHAFHEGFSVGLRMIAARADGGEQGAVVDGAVLMFGLLDVVSKAVSSAYLETYRAVATQATEHGNALATALLSGGANAASMAERVGAELAAGYEVVALHFPSPDDEIGAPGGRDAAAARTLHRLQTALIEHTAPAAPLAILSIAGGTVLIPNPTPTSAQELVAQLTEAGVVGVSATAVLTSAAKIPDAADNAYELLRLVQRLHYRPGIYRIADLALEYQIARPGGGRRHLERMLDPLRRVPDLLSTLEAFVGAEANRKKAAKQLVVHPNTVDYRLKRIGQITGIDPMKSSGLRSLHAALIADSLDPNKTA